MLMTAEWRASEKKSRFVTCRTQDVKSIVIPIVVQV